MPKTELWLLRAGLYLLAPLMVLTGLLATDSPLLAGIGLFIGLLTDFALQEHEPGQATDTERNNQQ